MGHNKLQLHSRSALLTHVVVLVAHQIGNEKRLLYGEVYPVKYLEEYL